MGKTLLQSFSVFYGSKKCFIKNSFMLSGSYLFLVPIFDEFLEQKGDLHENIL